MGRIYFIRSKGITSKNKIDLIWDGMNFRIRYSRDASHREKSYHRENKLMTYVRIDTQK